MPVTHHVAKIRHEVLIGMAQVLDKLASRAQRQVDAAGDIFRLAARAEEIAFQARALNSMRRPNGRPAESLARDVTAFIEEVLALRARACDEGPVGEEAVAALKRHAGELKIAAIKTEAVENLDRLRACLLPVLADITKLPAQFAARCALGTDLADLGNCAEALAEATTELQEGGRTPGVAAITIYRSLREFATKAAEISTRMLAVANPSDGTLRDMIAQVQSLTDYTAIVPPGGRKEVRDSPAAAVEIGTTEPRKAPQLKTTVNALDWSGQRVSIGRK